MLRAIQYLAALLVVGFGLWIFGTSSSFQTCTTEQAAANAGQGQKNLPPLVLAGANRAAIYARCGGHVIYEYRDFATAVATVFIAIFTFTLWQSTKRMMKATQTAVDLARQEFLSTHRPRIILREAFTTELKEGEDVKIRLHFANIGETTGTIFRSEVSAVVVPSERVMIHPTLDLNFDDAFGRITLRAGEARTIDFPSGPPIWRADMFRLKSVLTMPVTTRRDYTIHISGQFLYSDELGINRRTAFRRELHPERRRFYLIPDEPDLDYQD
jgi:hypothetical protein